MRRATGSAITDKPVVVLVNEGSASASEILSVPFKTTTAPSWLVRKHLAKDWFNPSEALLTAQESQSQSRNISRPKGTDIHKNGIKPDIESALSEKELKNFELKDFGTQNDRQYRVAEATLIKQIRGSNAATVYDPARPNLRAALGH